MGFEPTNGGFADLSLGPLGYRAVPEKSRTYSYYSILYIGLAAKFTSHFRKSLPLIRVSEVMPKERAVRIYRAPARDKQTCLCESRGYESAGPLYGRVQGVRQADEAVASTLRTSTASRYAFRIVQRVKRFISELNGN